MLQCVPLHFNRDVHLALVLGGVKRVKNSARAGRRSRATLRDGLHAGAARRPLGARAGGGRTAQRSWLLVPVHLRADEDRRAQWAGHEVAAEFKDSTPRTSRSATSSSWPLTLPQSMAMARSAALRGWESESAGAGLCLDAPCSTVSAFAYRDGAGLPLCNKAAGRSKCCERRWRAAAAAGRRRLKKGWSEGGGNFRRSLYYLYPPVMLPRQ